MIRAHKMTDRVIVGSFRQTAISEFRSACPEVATSASPAEVSEFLAMQKTGIAASYSPPFQALQIPVNAGFLNVVSKDFIEAAHRTKFAGSRLDGKSARRNAETFRNGCGRNYDRLSRPALGTCRTKTVKNLPAKKTKEI